MLCILLKEGSGIKPGTVQAGQPRLIRQGMATQAALPQANPPQPDLPGRARLPICQDGAVPTIAGTPTAGGAAAGQRPQSVCMEVASADVVAGFAPVSVAS